MPLIRKLGVRTVYEICTEKMVLKHLRGDFDKIPREVDELVKVAASEINNVRIEHTKKRLKTSSMKMYEIAQEVVFESPYYF